MLFPRSVEEYQAAFSSRPRVLRTPDVRGLGRSPVPEVRDSPRTGRIPEVRDSRGMTTDRPNSRGSPPTPKYSDSLPSSRPNSGGARPTSAGTGALKILALLIL